MALDTLAELLTLGLAVAAILVEPKRDQSAPNSWANLTILGRLALIAIICLSLLKIAKVAGDAATARRKEREHVAELARLRETNDYLLKAVSVGSGYNAVISGVAVFEAPPSELQTEKALRNLFLKYASINLRATSKHGVFHGRIDHGTHPEPRIFLRLAAVDHHDHEFAGMKRRLPPHLWSRAVAFRIRCGNLKLLNAQKVQYVVTDGDTGISADVEKVSFWSSFVGLYRVSSVYLDRLTIEEIGEVRLGHTL